MLKKYKSHCKHLSDKFVLGFSATVFGLMICAGYIHSKTVETKVVDSSILNKFTEIQQAKIEANQSIMKMKKFEKLSINDRKAYFISIILPIVQEINQKILVKRNQVFLLERKLKTNSLTVLDADTLKRLLREYKIRNNNISELKKRIDIIPISMTLAQAAIESGWGTSRFAVEGNAFFGQKIIGHQANGIKPTKSLNPEIKVKIFDSIDSSILGYYANLNTHSAYKNFRQNRQKYRKFGKKLTGLELANTLSNYSELGDKYIDRVKAVILANNLEKYDYLEFQSVKKY